MMAGRTQALSMYHRLLKEGGKFHNYNFREYALRRTKDAFRSNKTETNPEVIKQLLSEAEKGLTIVQRQVMLGNAFSHESIMNQKLTNRNSIGR